MYQRIGAAWWSRRLSTVVDRPRRSGIVHLRSDGDGIWWVGRDGAVTTMRDVKGLHYLRLVLQRPGVDVPALTMSDAVAGHPGARPATRTSESLGRLLRDTVRTGATCRYTPDPDRPTQWVFTAQ
jgi:hypothetical protein